jgi:hypothetical protein
LWPATAQPCRCRRPSRVCAGTALLVLTAEVVVVACDGAALPLPSTEPGVLRNFCKKVKKRSKKIIFFPDFLIFFRFSLFLFCDTVAHLETPRLAAASAAAATVGVDAELACHFRVSEKKKKRKRKLIAHAKVRTCVGLFGNLLKSGF